jgi:hypothetical protein
MGNKGGAMLLLPLTQWVQRNGTWWGTGHLFRVTLTGRPPPGNSQYKQLPLVVSDVDGTELSPLSQQLGVNQEDLFGRNKIT